MSTQNGQQRLEISVLENSYKYFLEHVILIKHPDRYRLLIIHQGNVLEDRDYKTQRGARIGFYKLFDRQKWKETDTPEWSDFYDPGKNNRNHYPYAVENYLKVRMNT